MVAVVCDLVDRGRGVPNHLVARGLAEAVVAVRVGERPDRGAGQDPGVVVEFHRELPDLEVSFDLVAIAASLRQRRHRQTAPFSYRGGGRFAAVTSGTG